MVNKTRYTGTSIRQLLSWVKKQMSPHLTAGQRSKLKLSAGCVVATNRARGVSVDLMLCRAREDRLPRALATALLYGPLSLNTAWRIAGELPWDLAPALVPKSKKPKVVPPRYRAEALIERWSRKVATEERLLLSTQQQIRRLKASADRRTKKLKYAQAMLRKNENRLAADKERASTELSDHDFTARMRAKQNQTPAPG